MNKAVVSLALLVLVYGILRWDYHLSAYLFSRLCAEPGSVGQFIYDTATVPREHLIRGDDNTVQGTTGAGYFLNDDYRIDKQYFDNRFAHQRHKVSKLHWIGPIYQAESKVVRRSDGTVLGRARTLVAKQGWLSNFFSQGYADVACPNATVLDANGLSEADRIHLYLLQETMKIPQPL